MPVLVKIPKKLEDTLGDDGSVEFITFMNSAFDDQKGDIIKESGLRFESKLEQAEARFESKLTKAMATLEIKIAKSEARLEAKIAGLETKIAGQMAGLETKIAQAESRMIKWFVGAAIAQIAIILSVLSFVIK